MKRTISLILLTALLLLLLIPFSGAVSLSFIAVNDLVPLTLSGDQRPYYAGGALYVPYTVFNTSSLGFYPSYSVTDKTLTLYSPTKSLVFDLAGGSVTDETRQTQSIAAVSRAGTVFLPAVFCAGHFGVSVSDLTSQGGYQVVRFTTGSQIYDDSLFLEKAENLLAYRISQYNASTGGSGTTTPSIPVNPVDPTQPDDPDEPEKEPPTIYLAVTGADALAAAVQTLNQYSVKATLFLTAEEISANADMVRRLSSEGHYIGLTVSQAEDIAGQLLQANDALNRVLQAQSLLVLLPEAAQQPELDSLYRIFYQPASRLTATEAAKAFGETRLLICDQQNLSESLRILKNTESQFLPLRETSQPET